MLKITPIDFLVKKHVPEKNGAAERWHVLDKEQKHVQNIGW